MTAGRGAPAREASPATRRQFLLGGAVLGGGALAALGVDRMLGGGSDAGAAQVEAGPADADAAAFGSDTVPFHGPHQAGVAAPTQSHASFLGLDLREDVGPEDLRRLMRVLTDDAARLTQGRAPLADLEPELAHVPARLTVTFAFGPRLLERAGVAGPEWLRPLPAFGIDRLRPELSDGDLVLMIAADDEIAVAHAARMLLKGARSSTTVRWVQRGFNRSAGAEQPRGTGRNLFGQLDGTVNPTPGTADFDGVVWIEDGPAAGGTSMVIRRIHMDLEGWDLLGRAARENSVGRTLDTGAPFTGSGEFDEPDLRATDSLGFPVIPAESHMRRARSDNPDERIFRRPYNYDEAPTGDEVSNSGQIFVSFQADVEAQFVPIQRRLDELDILNEWTTPIGSSVLLVPPGCTEGGYVGETLLG